MSRSSNLRLYEVRQVFRLVGDCQELGHDRDAWFTRAATGLRDSLGLVLSVGFCLPPIPSLHTAVKKTVAESAFWDVGWLSDRDRADWLALVSSPRILSYATAQKTVRTPARISAKTRDQLVPDREWYQSAEYEDRSALGQDDILIGQVRREDGLGLVFSLNRAVGDRPFTRRDRRIVHLFLGEVDRLVGMHRLITAPRCPSDSLPPRPRQVLEALAEGESEKQIAARLGLSRHTVHDYVKALHRHFDVASRGELIALFLRDRRPPVG